MKRVLVDMDDVLAECVKSWIKILNEQRNIDIKFEEITDWRWTDVRNKYNLTPEDTLDVLNEPEFFINLPVVPGAKEGLMELKEKGWEIVIVTTLFPWQADSGTKVADKQIWLDLHFEGIVDPSKVIMTSDKSLIKGTVLIDDAPKYLLPYQDKIIVFDRPWNRIEKLVHKPRAETWEGVVSYCNAILAVKETKQPTCYF